MLEASTSRSNGEPFFVGYINKIITSLFYKNHTAPKIALPFGKTNGVAKLFLAMVQTISKSVMILINPSVNFKVEKLISDKQGRFIILKVSFDEKNIVLVNIYAPNDVVQQVTFFQKLNKQLEEFAQDTIVIGGDFNCALTPKDKRGGTPFP